MGVSTKKSRVLGAGFAVTALTAGATVLAAAAPAAAAPPIAPNVGQAVAAEADFTFDLTVDGVDYTFDENATLGAVTSASGPQASSGALDPVVDLPWLSLDLGAWQSAAASPTTGPWTGAAAETSFSAAALELFGVPVLTVGGFSAETACPTIGSPAAAADITAVSFLGSDITAELADGAYETPTFVDLPAAGGLGELDIRVTLATEAVTTDATARTAGAVALFAQIELSGSTDDGALAATTVATVVLAAAECQSPLAVPAATAFTPASGPESGGTQVTITGANLGSVTGVLFGGAEATAVSVSADGTTVTATSPAGSGPVVLRLVLGTGETLEVPGGAFTYVAANNGGGGGGGGGANAGGTGAKVLAATGPGDLGPTVALGGLLLAAGLGAMALGVARRRRA